MEFIKVKDKIRTINSIEGNSVYTTQNNLVLCYELLLPEIGTKNLDNFFKVLMDSISSLPLYTIVHKVDYFFDEDFNFSVFPQTTFLEKEFVKFFANRKKLVHKSYIFFTYQTKCYNLTSLLNPITNITSKVRAEQDYFNTNFILEVERVVKAVNDEKIVFIKPLEKNNIQDFDNAFFNLGNPFFVSDIDFRGEELKIGDNYVAVVSINDERRFNDMFSVIQKDNILSTINEDFYCSSGEMFGIRLQMPHIYSQMILIDDPKNWQDYISKKAPQFERYKSFDIVNEKIYNQFSDMKKTIVDGQLSIKRANNTIIVFDKTKKGLENKLNNLNSILNRMEVKYYKPNPDVNKFMFLCTHPFFAPAIGENNLYVGSDDLISSLINIETNYNNEKEGIVFNDLFNNPFIYNLWDKEKVKSMARNALLLGPTGQGKSVIVNWIIRQYLDQNIKVVCIDLGSSYYKLSLIYKDVSVFIKFEEGKPLNINPFNDTTKKLLTLEKLNSLARFIMVHLDLKDEKKENLNIIYWRHIIKVYIEQTQEKQRNVKRFFNWYVESFEALNNLAQIEEVNSQIDHITNIINIKEYLTGAYSFLYTDEISNTSLQNKQFVIYELAKIKKDPKLLRIALEAIDDTIDNNIWADIHNRGLVVYDEFAEQLNWEGEKVLRDTSYRYEKARKTLSQMLIILQTIHQLPQNKFSESIVENSDIIMALKNEKKYNEVMKRLKIDNPLHINMLNSLQSDFSGKYKFSSLFIKHGSVARVVRIELDPASYYTFMSDGEENSQIIKRLEKSEPYNIILQDFLQK